MITFLFPGQGSQQKGMGQGLFDLREYTSVEAEVDRTVGYSMRKLCLEDTDGRLKQTQYTQPCLYVVNALHYYKALSQGMRPAFLAGHSLGEYNALWVAGVFDFLTGLRLVKKRGELMAQAQNGGMTAVAGLDASAIEKIIAAAGLTSIDIANFNSPSQVVISGPTEDIKRLGPMLEKAGAKMVMPLPVSAAFHSRYMSDAAREFSDFIAQHSFEAPKLPVVANATGEKYPMDGTAQSVASLLVRQITNPVLWTQSVRSLMDQGSTDFREMGPGNVLTRLLQQIQQTPQIRSDLNGSSRISAITAESLGSIEFKKDYGLRYAYVAGAMYKGIASKELVVAMGKAGMIGFFGSGGLDLTEIEAAIRFIKKELASGQPYGMNLLCNPERPDIEEQTVDLFLKSGVRYVEAAAFARITPSLVRWRLKGLKRNPDGKIERPQRTLAKVSRPEVAAAFMQPAPEAIIKALLAAGKITPTEADLGRSIPIADEICVEADSAGHTDQGVAYALTPAIMVLRDEMMLKYRYDKLIKIGAAGGIGTPHAAAAALIMGADFVLTGSINQCTVEAGTSAAAKDVLERLNAQDTDYAPAGDMFEIGARIQVASKGLFFPARANKLYELYKQYNSIEEIDEKTRQQIQERYFKRSFEDVWNETRSYYLRAYPGKLADIEKNSKQKMALIFRWYFVHSARLAMHGSDDQKVDYQIHCGPAMGAFNQWVKGSDLQSWRNRHVAEIGLKIMKGAAEMLSNRFESMRTDRPAA
jgi:trans-AT polyketide synthase, acyltransferase and oxidoreductase domains